MSDAFELWLDAVFDHPAASDRQTRWFNAADAAVWDAEADPGLTLAHIDRLFSKPEVLLDRYTPDQIAQGLWFLADPSSSSHLFALVDPALAWPLRRHAIQAITTLYEGLFMRICEPRQSRLEPADQPATQANRLCYMFWELAPLGPRGATARDEDLIVLETMREILANPYLPCQESVLHGLEHWVALYPVEVEALIKDFLIRPSASEDLRAYAAAMLPGA